MTQYQMTHCLHSSKQPIKFGAWGSREYMSGHAPHRYCHSTSSALSQHTIGIFTTLHEHYYSTAVSKALLDWFELDKQTQMQEQHPGCSLRW